MSSSIPSYILDRPLRPPPPGQVSNFENPQSRRYEIYAIAGICLPFITIFAMLRFYAKLKIIKRKTWDDLTCAIGVVAGTTYICLAVGEASGGTIGYHAWDIQVRKYTKKQLVVSLLVESLYGPCLWLVKLSLFVLYLEIFGRLNWLRYSAFAGMILTGAFYALSLALTWVFCGPRDGQSQLSFLKARSTPQCMRLGSLVLAQGIMNVVSDIYLILLPLPAVWTLQIPMRRKLGVAAMILTGSIACITSMVGLKYRVQLIRDEIGDATWIIVPTIVTTVIEMTAGLLVCCMPAMTSVLKPCLSRCKSVVSRSSQRSLLPSETKSVEHSARIVSTSELQLTTVDTTYHAWVSPCRHQDPPYQVTHDDRVEESKIKEANLPYHQIHIRKVTNIDII